MSPTDQRLLIVLERVEKRLERKEERDAARHKELRDWLITVDHRVRTLESDRDKRSGAKTAVMGVVGIGAGTGLWAWLMELFRHGGK